MHFQTSLLATGLFFGLALSESSIEIVNDNGCRFKAILEGNGCGSKDQPAYSIVFGQLQEDGTCSVGMYI